MAYGLMGKRLDDKLDCKRCGTISLEIPDDADDNTPIHCSSCGDRMGTWRELTNNFYHQAGRGVFDLDDGNIEEH